MSVAWGRGHIHNIQTAYRRHCNERGCNEDHHEQGSFAFDFCNVAEAQTLSAGDKLFVSHFKNVANLHTDPPGGPFDRTSAVCLGTYTNINGHQVAYRVCEATDEDNDTFWLEFHGSPDGAGEKTRFRSELASTTE